MNNHYDERGAPPLPPWAYDRGWLTTYDQKQPLETSPHYSDPRFKKEQTVFGKPANDSRGHPHLHYDYSDRLWEWNPEKAELARETANKKSVPAQSCLYYQTYLSAYYGKLLIIEHIIAGVNRSNGYPYIVFGYREASEETTKEEQNG